MTQRQIRAGREADRCTERAEAQKESCQQGLAQIEEQEAQLSQGEEALAGARAQLEALQAQYEQAVASGEYEQEDLDARLRRLRLIRSRWRVSQRA